MVQALKKQWKAFKREEPGSRFKERYEREQRAERRSGWARIARFVVAIAALAVALLLSVMPGPAILFFFIAGTLLASESLVAARMLDWLEVKLRKFIFLSSRMWRRCSAPVRVALVGGIAVLAGASSWACYQLLSNRS